MCHTSLLAAFACALLPAVVSARVIHVKPTGSDQSSGFSWNTAKKTITNAISIAAGGDQLWIAAGVYTERVTLRNNVRLYGGFIGTETDISERDWLANLTVIDGSQQGTVITAPAGVLSLTVVDGFTIRNGRASLGGGILCVNSSPWFSYCRITNNDATTSGGGIGCDNASPIFDQCRIDSNDAATYGGGVYTRFDSFPEFLYCTIEQNTANSGGGAYMFTGAASFQNCEIRGNTANSGGGIYSSSSSSVFQHCRIKGNTATNTDGGGLFLFSSTPTVSNCVVLGNTANFSGGGLATSGCNGLIANNTIVDNHAVVFNGGGASLTGGTLTFTNNIIAFNSSGVYRSGSQMPVIKNNCLYNPSGYEYQGWTSDGSDIFEDPRFRDYAADLHLLADSPCIDAGDDAPVLPWWSDMDGQQRIMNVRVDIGVDEFLPDTNGDWCVDDTDLTELILQFGSEGPGLVCDFNNDGIVDDDDLTVLVLFFGAGCEV